MFFIGFNIYVFSYFPKRYIWPKIELYIYIYSLKMQSRIYNQIYMKSQISAKLNNLGIYSRWLLEF